MYIFLLKDQQFDTTHYTNPHVYSSLHVLRIDVILLVLLWLRCRALSAGGLREICAEVPTKGLNVLLELVFHRAG